MPSPPPAEVVRLLFEARLSGNVRRVCALLDPDIEAVSSRGVRYDGVEAVRAFLTGDGRNVETLAQVIEPDSDDRVLVYGRRRRHGRGSMADSPAAWRMTVRAGRVASIVALAPPVVGAAA